MKEELSGAYERLLELETDPWQQKKYVRKKMNLSE